MFKEVKTLTICELRRERDFIKIRFQHIINAENPLFIYNFDPLLAPKNATDQKGFYQDVIMHKYYFHSFITSDKTC